jgi:hypothetical protein
MTAPTRRYFFSNVPPNSITGSGASRNLWKRPHGGACRSHARLSGALLPKQSGVPMSARYRHEFLEKCWSLSFILARYQIVTENIALSCRTS